MRDPRLRAIDADRLHAVMQEQPWHVHVHVSRERRGTPQNRLGCLSRSSGLTGERGSLIMMEVCGWAFMVPKRKWRLWVECTRRTRKNGDGGS